MATYKMEIIDKANREMAYNTLAQYGRDFVTEEIQTEAETAKQAEEILLSMIPEGYTRCGAVEYVWTEEEREIARKEAEAERKAREKAHAERMAKKAEAVGMTVEEYEKNKEIQRKIKRAEKYIAELEKEMETLKKKIAEEREYIERLKK